MAELKTKPNDASVIVFLDAGQLYVLAMMKKVTGLEPKICGDAIIGFGSQHDQFE